jgi:aspartyl-tRNA(Asn)/glutamyl-tRNA(Gln) amidotransferase subunit A
MHELALGATGINPRFGTTTNPWDETRIAGGSSGGSAVAVALGQVHVALGTDSGGSVRLPAAMCGVVGFKPTGGAIPLDGVKGAAWSIDSVGIFASNVGDVAKVWDNLSSERSRARTDPIRIGYLQDDSMGRVDPPVWSAYLAAIEELKRSDLDLTGVSLPNLTSAPYLCVSVVYPEIASQHHELVREHPEMYGDEIRTIVYLGELWSARNYLDAQRLRVTMEAEFRSRTLQYDAVLMPTAPVQPPPIGEPAHVAGDPEGPALYTMMRFTVPFNVIGYPAISIPAGSDHDGLPFGLQVVGKPNRDNDLLDIAQRMEGRLGALSLQGAGPKLSHNPMR